MTLKMKSIHLKIIVSIFTIILVMCRKDNDNDSGKPKYYYPSSISITPDSARRFDTVLINFNTTSTIPDSLQTYTTVFVAGRKARIVGFPSSKSVKIQIPDSLPVGKWEWNDARAKVKLMIKKEYSETDKFFIYIKPEIQRVNPLSGKTGDVLTIYGKDLISVDFPKYLINTLPCEVIDSSDTLVHVKVPKDCGHGAVSIWNYDCGSPYWYHKYKLIDKGPMFTYNFTTPKVQYANKVNESGTIYLITRDQFNKVSRRDVQGKNKHEIFKYGTDGLLDSVLSYTADTLSGYSIYFGDTSSLWTEDRFNYKGVKYKQQKYYYTSGRLSKILEYVSDGSGGFYLQIQSDYAYLGESNIIYVKTFALDGNIKSSVTYHSGYDLKNKVFDMYAPGFPKRDQYNQTIAPAGEIQYVYYNEFGNMYKTMTLSSCTNIFTTYEIEYAQ